MLCTTRCSRLAVICLLCLLTTLSSVSLVKAQVFYPISATIASPVAGDAIIGYADTRYAVPTSPTVTLTTGGSISGTMSVYNGSRFTMMDGVVSGTIGVTDMARVNILKGTAGHDVYAYQSSVTNIRGGNITGNIVTFDSSVVNIRGGSVGNSFYLLGGSTINLFGYNLKSTLVNPNYSGYSAYTLSGTLADGTVLRDKALLVANGSQAHFALKDVGYTITEFGSHFYPTGINNKGEVIGSGIFASPFLYRHGVITPLTNYIDFFPIKINDIGQIAGTQEPPPYSFGTSHAALLSGTSVTIVPDKQLFPYVDPKHPDNVRSTPIGLNNKGAIVGSYSFIDYREANPYNRTRAFVYDGTMTDLGILANTLLSPPPPGGVEATSIAYGINAVGQVVGEVDNSAFGFGGKHGGSRAFLYNAGITLLPLLSGFNENSAHCINNKGQIAGLMLKPLGFGNDLFLYSDGVTTDLGSGSPFSHANGINERGQIVGNDGHNGFLYRDGHLFYITNLLPAGYMVDDATGINEAGQIVATASHNGSYRGLLLTPLVAPNQLPVTTASVLGTEGSNGWYRSKVFVFLTATDPDVDDDVAKTTYEVDGGPTLTYTGTIPLEEGRHTITFRSTDLSGEEEATKANAVNVDTVRPFIDARAQCLMTVGTAKITNNQEITRPESALAAIDVYIMGHYTEDTSGIDPQTIRFTVVDSFGKVQPTGNVLLLTDNKSFDFHVTLDFRSNVSGDARDYTIFLEAKDYAGNPTVLQLGPKPYSRSVAPFNVRTRGSAIGQRG